MKFKVGDLVVGKCKYASEYVVVGRRWWLFNWYIRVASTVTERGTWRREELFNYAPTKDSVEAWRELNDDDAVTSQKREILRKLSTTCDRATLNYYIELFDSDRAGCL